LKAQVSSEYVLLDSAISSNTVDAATKTKTGTVVEKFNYEATVKASAIAFKKADIDEFAKKYILSQVPEGKILLDNSYKMNYTAGAVDVSGGKAMLNLDFSSGVYKSIDKVSTALSLMGKNASQINDTVNNTLGQDVSKIKIKFWPFWVTSAPASQKAVKVELKF
jgi:hypothetical protein